MAGVQAISLMDYSFRGKSVNMKIQSAQITKVSGIFGFQDWSKKIIVGFHFSNIDPVFKVNIVSSQNPIP